MKRIFLLSIVLSLTISFVNAQTISLPCYEPAIIGLGLTGPNLGTVYGCQNNCQAYNSFSEAANDSGITHMSTDISTNCGNISPCHADFNVTDNGSSSYSFGDSSELGSSQVSFAWDYGDGATDVGQFPAPHTYSTSGYKLACLAIYDSANFCPSATCRVILVGSASNCTPAFTAVTSCGVTTFTDVSTGTYTGVGWEMGDGGTGNTQPGGTFEYQYLNEGTYTVTISLTCSGGTTANSFPVTVTFPTVDAGFTYAASGTVSPYLVTFSNTSTDASSYTWYFGDGSADSVMTPAVHSYDSCDYTVWLIAQDTNYCTDTFASTIDACSNGILEISSSLSSMSVYPNPANDFLQITMMSIENGGGLLQVKDVMGKNVLNEQEVRISRGRNNYSLNLESLPAGIYLVQVLSGNSIVNSRVLIK